MESLSDTFWDVVLSGTGLPQSLLALALSRSGKKVLHVDKNDYYGGVEAALSLQEAEIWLESTNAEIYSGSFSHASLERPEHDPHVPKLGFPRSYSLSLAPQLIYTRSNLLPALVSSKVYRQLEFLAVGSWYLYGDGQPAFDASEDSAKKAGGEARGELRKIPGGREDVFVDKTIDLRSARSLMKFLRLAADAETHAEILSDWGSKPFPDYLASRFMIPTKLQPPLLALTLSPNPPAETTTAFALPRIHRHLTSIGMFGPGFGAVIPKWGGLAEVAQVACRAGAVGGGVYVLKRGIKSIRKAGESTTREASTASQEQAPTSIVELDDGDLVRARWIAGTSGQLPIGSKPEAAHETRSIQRSITIVSSPLSELFSVSVEGSPPLDGAVVIFPTGSVGAQDSHSPVHLLVHTSSTGECPDGQCVIYAYTTSSSATSRRSSLLSQAVSKLLASIRELPKPEILWSLSYQQKISNTLTPDFSHESVIHMSDVPLDLALEDNVLRNVRATWERIVGDDVGMGFMTFEDREPVEGEEGNDQ